VSVGKQIIVVAYLLLKWKLGGCDEFQTREPVCSVLCSLGVSAYLSELMNICYCHIKETVFSNVVCFIINQKVCKVLFFSFVMHT
jgi:hypothetical protein